MSVKEIGVLIDAAKKRPHVACFIISVFLVVFILLDLQGAVVSKDYLPVVAEIRNIESHREYEGRHKVTRYDYDVVWEIEGTQYIHYFKNQLERKSPGTVNIWVSPDNTDVRFSSSDDIHKKAPLFFGGAIITGVLGILFWIRKRKEICKMSSEELEDYLEGTEQLTGMMAVLFLLIIVFSGYVLYEEKMLFNMTGYQVAAFVVYGVVFVICLAIYIYTYRKLGY